MAPCMRDETERLAASSAFAGCEPAHLRALVEDAAEPHEVAPGECILGEGDEADALWVLLEGEVELCQRREPAGELVLARLAGTRVLDESTLFEREPRSVSVRALSFCRLLRVPLDRFEALPVAATVRANLARAVTRRLNEARRTAAQCQAAVVEERRGRVALSGYMVRIFAICVFYLFVMSEVTNEWAYGPQYSFFLALTLLLFALVVWSFIRSDVLPRGIFGLSLGNWRRVSVEAVLWALPLMVGIVVIKAALIHTVPRFAEVPLFDFGAPWRPTLGYFILVETLYTVFVPVQQFIARSGMQAPFESFSSGRHRRMKANVISGLLFSAMHLHFGPAFAIAVFPMSLYWGWMFTRQRSLLGVSLSHILLGNFMFAVVGVSGIIPES
jgi:CRP-like cAMP-binding protein/membrane protease YdiL (CAAX protease family)